MQTSLFNLQLINHLQAEIILRKKVFTLELESFKIRVNLIRIMTFDPSLQISSFQLSI